jgi:type I restriction enzyme S subunit
MTAAVTANLALFSEAPGGIKALRQLILDLAIAGRLVPQQESDEPAGAVLIATAAMRSSTRARRAGSVGHSDRAERPPRGWVATTVGDVLVCRDGERIPVSQADREVRAKVYDYYGASGVIDRIDGFLFDKPLLLVGEDGANLVNRSTPIAFIARGKYWVNNHAHVLDGIDEDLLRYMVLFFNAIDLKPYVTGTAQPKLNQAKLNAIPVALPPLAEQHRIVAKVDELMALCDRLEARQQGAEAAHTRLVQALLGSLTQARDAEEFQACWQRVHAHFSDLFTTDESVEALKQVVLQAACSGRLIATTSLIAAEPSARYLDALPKASLPFAIPPDWRWTRLGDLCALVTSGSRGWKDYYADKGSTFIRSQDIKFDRLEFDRRAFVALPLNAEGARTQVQQYDLLITITGANVGKAAVLTEAPDDAYVSQHVALVRLRDPLQAAYIHRWLTNSYGGRSILLSSSYGAKPGLNLQNIKDLPVPLPPLAEQRRIVAKVTELLALCDQLKARIAAARAKHAQLAEALVAQAVA